MVVFSGEGSGLPVHARAVVNPVVESVACGNRNVINRGFCPRKNALAYACFSIFEGKAPGKLLSCAKGLTYSENLYLFKRSNCFIVVIGAGLVINLNLLAFPKPVLNQKLDRYRDGYSPQLTPGRLKHLVVLIVRALLVGWNAEIACFVPAAGEKD